jgi:hypothetical protein
MGVSPSGAVDEDMRKAVATYQELLGPESHAEDKDERGRQLDMLGWSIDLESRTITLSERNRLKTLYGLLQVDVDQPVRVSDVERLASWASRYGLVMPVLKPLAKSWVEGEKFTGLFGRAAAVALMHILSCGRIRIGATIHVPAEFNELCDDLSRNRIPKSLSGTKRFQNQSLLEIMDPMRQEGGDFFWK